MKNLIAIVLCFMLLSCGKSVVDADKCGNSFTEYSTFVEDFATKISNQTATDQDCLNFKAQVRSIYNNCSSAFLNQGLSQADFNKSLDDIDCSDY